MHMIIQAAGGKQSNGMHSKKMMLSTRRKTDYQRDILAKQHTLKTKVAIGPCSMTDTAIRLQTAAITVLPACGRLLLDLHNSKDAKTIGQCSAVCSISLH